MLCTGIKEETETKDCTTTATSKATLESITLKVKPSLHNTCTGPRIFLSVQLNWSIFVVPLEEGIFLSQLISYKIPWSAAALSLKREDVFYYLPSPFFFLMSHIPKASCSECPQTFFRGAHGCLYCREKRASLGISISTLGILALSGGEKRAGSSSEKKKKEKKKAAWSVFVSKNSGYFTEVLVNVFLKSHHHRKKE